MAEAWDVSEGPALTNSSSTSYAPSTLEDADLLESLAASLPTLAAGPRALANGLPLLLSIVLMSVLLVVVVRRPVIPMRRSRAAWTPVPVQGVPLQLPASSLPDTHPPPAAYNTFAAEDAAWAAAKAQWHAAIDAARRLDAPAPADAG